MSTFEIGTCFSTSHDGTYTGISNIDAEKVAAAVAEFVDQEEGSGYFNGSAWFSLKSYEVFCGTRRTHTNVNFTVKVPDMAAALKVRDAVSEATGRQWNAPTQDPDEVEAELAGQKSWGMFTSEGARMVAGSMELLEEHLRSGVLSPVKLEDAVEVHCKAIARDGHGEVFDTAVREEIWDRLDSVLAELGLARTV